MNKLLIIILAIFLSGCSVSGPKKTYDAYSGKELIEQNNFYVLKPIKTLDSDRIAFAYKYEPGSNEFTLKAGFASGASAMAAAGGRNIGRTGITNVFKLNFMVDGKEYSFESTGDSYYDGFKMINEIGMASSADGSYALFIIPTEFLNTLANSNKVMVRLGLGKYYKDATFKDGKTISAAAVSLSKLGTIVFPIK